MSAGRTGLLVLLVGMLQPLLPAAKDLCEECVPTDKGVYMVTRLWTIDSPDLTDMDVIGEFQSGFAPVVTALPGFLEYGSAQTGNESTVFFWNMFDSEENAAAAQAAAVDFVKGSDLLKDDAIVPYYFTEMEVANYISNTDCPNESNKGKYLSTRLFAGDPLTVEYIHDRVTITNQEQGFSNMTGFESYLGAVSSDGTQRLFANVFDTEEQGEDANAQGKASAQNSVAAETFGSIVFDYICADHGENAPEGSAGGDSVAATFSVAAAAFVSATVFAASIL